MKNVFFFLWLARRDTLYLLFLSWRGTENEVEAKSGIMRKPGLACALAIPRHRFVFEGIKAARLIKDLQKTSIFVDSSCKRKNSGNNRKRLVYNP